METPERYLELVRQMQTGDQQAFSVVYDEFADRLYKFIRLKVSTGEEAEDILQEVFVKAWTNCRQLSLSADLNFSAWLYRIASNTVNDYYRKTYRRPQTVELTPDLNLPATTDDNSDVEQLTEKQFDAKDIHAALDQLPPHYRQIIELRYFQEFSIEDTSKILNKSSVSVRVLQYRATKKLQQLFKHHEQEFKKFI